MAKVPYNKPALTYKAQLSQLKERGLRIDDEGSFLDILEKKSYYRLSGYWYPLLSDKANHIFKKGARFEDAYSMYSFDRDLRQLIIKELEKVEIAVRAKMIYIFSHQFDPFWYTHAYNFKKSNIHYVCAHHSRLWNRVMRIQPMIPTSPKNQWLNNISIPNDRVYYILSMIIYLLESINDQNYLIDDFKTLLTSYPNIHVEAMGFPSKWDKEPLWSM